MTQHPYQHCSRCGLPGLTAVSAREFVCPACGYRHFITPIPAACALVLDSADRLLVIRRAHAPGLGLLGLPGGVVEPGESGEEGAARETWEEVGLALPPEAFRYLGTFTNQYLFQDWVWPTLDVCYVARVASFGALAPDSAEVSEYLFLPLQEVREEEFAFSSNVQAVRRLLETLGGV